MQDATKRKYRRPFNLDLMSPCYGGVAMVRGERSCCFHPLAAALLDCSHDNLKRPVHYQLSEQPSNITHLRPRSTFILYRGTVS